jgi:hypothetical protein
MNTEWSKLGSCCLPTDALSSPIHRCTAATAGLTASSATYHYVSTNAQLLRLSTCTSIDYLWIYGCTDCTQAAWCGLQLQSITANNSEYGRSLHLSTTPGISDMCGIKNLKGALTGGFGVLSMDGIVSLDGAEDITSVGVNSFGISIWLDIDPILTSAIALANAEYPAGTLRIQGNTILECVPSAWPATDMHGRTIPHGSCPTTPAPTPAPGSIGSTGGDMTSRGHVSACSAGKFRDSDDCKLCPSGQYQPVANSSSCTSVCPNNEDGSRLYVVPAAGSRLADPSVALVGSSPGTTRTNWIGGVLSRNGYIYCIPFHSNKYFASIRRREQCRLSGPRLATAAPSG